MTWAKRGWSAAARKSAAAHRTGKPHPHKGHPMSAATRAKLSAALKGRHHPGHKLSAATKAKIAAALKGRHHAGHAVSAATRAKISAALKGRHGTRPVRMSASQRRHAARAALNRQLHPTGVVRRNPLIKASRHRVQTLLKHKRVRKVHALAQHRRRRISYQPRRRITSARYRRNYRRRR